MVVAGIRSPLGRALRDAAASPHPRVVVPEPGSPARLRVADGHLTGVDCRGPSCVRGVGHDLQALLVLARRSARPRWGAEMDGRPHGARVAVADVLSVCEAAVTPEAAVSPFWVDPRVVLELGAGPHDGGELRLRTSQWRVLRLLLVGGLPALAADGAWEVAAEVLLERAAAVRGAESCPVLVPASRLSSTARTPIGVPPSAVVAPDQTAPDQTAPDQVASERAASDRVVPDRAAPERAAPDRVVPDRVAPVGAVPGDQPAPASPAPEPRAASEVDTVTVDTAAVQAALDRAAANGSRPPARPEPDRGPMPQRVPGTTLRSLENGSGAAPDRDELRRVREAAERAAGSPSVPPGPSVEPDTLRRLMQRLRNL